MSRFRPGERNVNSDLPPNTDPTEFGDVISNGYKMKPMNNIASSIQLLGSIKDAHQHSQSLMLDKVSVREIMDTCEQSIGQDGGTVSLAQKEIKQFAEEKGRTDDAMDRLKDLYVNYIDQLAPVDSIASEEDIAANSPAGKQFMEEQKEIRNAFKKRKKRSVFQGAKILDDEKTVDLMMRDELHNECFMNRCFENAQELKKKIVLVGKSF